MNLHHLPSDVGLRPFSDRQIALLQNFAAQAVIAITGAETYRALQTRTADLQESQEYQTATGDVLKVISRSTFDLQPVFETIVETATRLCDADAGAIANRENEALRIIATFSAEPVFKAFLHGRLLPIDRSTVIGRATPEGTVVEVADIAADPEYTLKETITLQKARSVLAVPLLRERGVVGAISLVRGRVQPFTDRQIELLRTFADQAVIAIENTRLITEQREALEPQTATAEVLQVINNSPGNLTPVFDKMLERALHLCESAFGVLATYDGQAFHQVAFRGVTPELAEFMHQPFRPGPGLALHRVLQGEDVVQIADIVDDDAYRSGISGRREMVDLGGARAPTLGRTPQGRRSAGCLA